MSAASVTGCVCALVPLFAFAGSTDVYYERALMSAANVRCHLFAPDLASALDSAAAQAHGAALRAGATAQSLAQIDEAARQRAERTACNAPDLAVATARVRAAFEGYAQLRRMSFPGDTAAWEAQRSVSQRATIWRLSQSSRFGADSVVFGLAGRDGASALIAVVHFADGAQPYAARLIVRDTVRAPAPFVGGFAQGGRAGLAARMPMRGATTAFTAEARDDADPSLLPAGSEQAIAFRFPRSAIDVLAGLDPREAVAIEFAFEGGDRESVRTAYIEVGDFAAGRAFLVAAQR